MPRGAICTDRSHAGYKNCFRGKLCNIQSSKKKNCYQVLKLGKYNLRCTSEHDILQCVIIWHYYRPSLSLRWHKHWCLIGFFSVGFFQFIHPSIHFLYRQSVGRAAGGLEPIPAIIRRRRGTPWTGRQSITVFSIYFHLFAFHSDLHLQTCGSHPLIYNRE